MGVYDMFGTIWEWTEDFSSVMMSGESRKDNTTNETLFCAGASGYFIGPEELCCLYTVCTQGSVKPIIPLTILVSDVPKMPKINKSKKVK